MPKIRKSPEEKQLNVKRKSKSVATKPVVKQHIYVTAHGLSEVKEELNLLTTDKRKEIADRIQVARELGDLAENSEYDAALEEQALLENRIVELESMLAGAKLIADNVSSDFVVIGSTVRIEMDGEIDEFTIVGRVEADPSKKKISNESPVGAALLGARAGEEVEVTTPIIRYKCKILEVK